MSAYLELAERLRNDKRWLNVSFIAAMIGCLFSHGEWSAITWLAGVIWAVAALACRRAEEYFRARHAQEATNAR